MSTFTREEVKDIIQAIDLVTGAYSEDLEVPIMGLYRHDSPGFHRLRSVQHRLLAEINEMKE